MKLVPCVSASESGFVNVPITDCLVDKLIQYETSELSEEETIIFFQSLIDTGLLWQLKGHYLQLGQQLLDAKVCVPLQQAA